MKILVLGANGQLGSDIVRVAQASGHTLAAFHGRKELDVTRAEDVADALATHRPDVLINTAARCDVDACESDALRAFEVNALGPRNVAQACEAARAFLIHMSTDYVFSGEKGRPYVETDAPNPVNTYGISKLAGEQFVRACCTRHLVVRSSGLYGVQGSREKGGNFVETMVRLSGERPELRLVCDQFLSPTYTVDLAQAILTLAEKEVHGSIHLCNPGVCSWLEWAQEIFRQLDRPVKTVPVSMEEFAAKARRPRFSALESAVLPGAGLKALPPWPNALERYLRARGHLKTDSSSV